MPIIPYFLKNKLLYYKMKIKETDLSFILKRQNYMLFFNNLTFNIMIYRD